MLGLGGGHHHVLSHSRTAVKELLSDGEDAEKLHREKGESQGKRKCRELRENVCRKKIRDSRTRSEGAEDQTRLLM